MSWGSAEKKHQDPPNRCRVICQKPFPHCKCQSLNLLLNTSGNKILTLLTLLMLLALITLFKLSTLFSLLTLFTQLRSKNYAFSFMGFMKSQCGGLDGMGWAGLIISLRLLQLLEALVQSTCGANEERLLLQPPLSDRIDEEKSHLINQIIYIGRLMISLGRKICVSNKSCSYWLAIKSM